MGQRTSTRRLHHPYQMAPAKLAALVRRVSAGFAKALARNPVPLDLARYHICPRRVGPRQTGSSARGRAPLTPPPARSAELQHRAYMKALESRVQSILVMPAAADQPDCVFVEDAAVCIGQKYARILFLPAISPALPRSLRPCPSHNSRDHVSAGGRALFRVPSSPGRSHATGRTVPASGGG